MARAVLDRYLKLVEESQGVFEGDAHALLIATYQGKYVPSHQQLRAAALALPFESPKLSVVGVTRDDGTFAAQLDRAIARSRNGKVTLELQANPEAGEVGAAAAGKVAPRRFG
jgi:hypothetical protein